MMSPKLACFDGAVHLKTPAAAAELLVQAGSAVLSDARPGW
jgi:hypothetical protein